MLPVKALNPSPAERLPTLGFGPFTFDRHSQLLRRDGVEAPLPPRVLGVLDLLISRPGDIVARQTLIDAVWKDAFVTDTSLAEAVSFLRQTLADDPQTPTYIQTVHRRGYRFVAPVADVSPAHATALDASPAAMGAPEKVSPSIGGHLLPWSIAAIATVLALAAVWQFTHLREPLPPVVRLQVDPAPGTAFDNRAPALALSPDGARLAWSGCDRTACRLYVRALDQLVASALAGTEDASAPFFSPDGRWIGFFAAGKLKKVALAGGGPISLTDAPQTFGATWLPDGRIVFAASAYGGLLQVNDRGGDAIPLTQPSADDGEISHAWPSAMAGGALLFSIGTSPLDDVAGRIAAMPADRPAGRVPWRTIIDAGDAARAIGRSYIAFSRGTELHAVAFDPARLATAGVEQVVETGVAPRQFAVSEGGALAYGGVSPDSQPSITGLPQLPGVAALRMPALSMDGRRLAGVGGDTSSSDIWVADVDRGVTTRLTHGGVNVSPVWNADGTAVLFSAAKTGVFELWARDRTAAAPEHRILEPGRGKHVFPTSVSRDGRLVAFVESGGATRADIWIAPLPGSVIRGPGSDQIADAGSRTAVPVVQTMFDDVSGMLSPDGRLLAYQSDESGRWQIYLVRLVDKHRVAVSTAGGMRPFWSPDGRTLLYRAGTDLVGVAVDPAGDRVGAPTVLRPLSGAEPVAFLADQLVLHHRADTRAQHAVLTLEWIRELRQKLGPPTTTLPR
jgi:eukaryotic-like serine/threonine-protein kinase